MRFPKLDEKKISMIENLAADHSLSWNDVSERVGVSATTCRKYGRSVRESTLKQARPEKKAVRDVRHREGDIVSFAAPTTAGDEELDTLRTVMAQAGVERRLDSIVSIFGQHPNWDDLPELDRLMSDAGASTPARLMALQDWARRRGLPNDYVRKRYSTTVPSLESAVGTRPVVAEKKAASKTTMELMQDHIDIMQTLQQMEMTQSGVRPPAPEKKDGLVDLMEDQVRIEKARKELQDLRRPYKAPEKPQEPKTIRTLHDGTQATMTDTEWIRYHNMTVRDEKKKRLELQEETEQAELQEKAKQTELLEEHKQQADRQAWQAKKREENLKIRDDNEEKTAMIARTNKMEMEREVEQLKQLETRIRREQEAWEERDRQYHDQQAARAEDLRQKAEARKQKERDPQQPVEEETHPPSEVQTADVDDRLGFGLLEAVRSVRPKLIDLI